MQKLKYLLIATACFSAPALASETTVTTEMNTSFQFILDEVAHSLHKELPSAFARSCEATHNKVYRCGELPVGTIDDDNFKSLVKFKIPKKSFNKDGFKGTFPETEVDVSLSRKQWGGVEIPEKLIGSDEIIKTSSYMGRDIYIRMSSNNNKLGGVTCVYVPGVKTRVSKIENSFTAKKKILLMTSKTKIKTRITIGEGSFDAIKSCFAFQVVPTLDSKTELIGYKYDVVAISKPQILNLKKGKIEVNVDVKGANFLGSIVNMFAKSFISKEIKKAIQKEVAQEVDDIYESDVLDGQWFAKYLNSSTVKFTNHVSEQLKAALQKPAALQGEEIESDYVNACQRLRHSAIAEFKKVIGGVGAPTGRLQKFTDDFDQFCASFQNLSFAMFTKDVASNQAGCYARSVRVTDLDPILRSRIMPTAVPCKFSHVISMKTSPEFKPLGQCMLNQWKHKFSLSCEREVAQLIKKNAGL